MNQRRLFRLLLQPSLFSGTAVCMLIAATLGSNAWAIVSSKQLFYEYLFGPYGFETYLWQQSAQASSIRDAFLASPVVYYILIGLAAAVIGCTVYALLQTLGVLFAWRMWSGLAIAGDHRAAVRALASRLTVRVISLIGWAVYAAFFFSTFLPFSLLLGQTGISRILLHDTSGWLLCAGAIAVLGCALHLHVIFMRLVGLRPRVFGGDDAIESALAHRNR